MVIYRDALKLNLGWPQLATPIPEHNHIHHIRWMDGFSMFGLRLSDAHIQAVNRCYAIYPKPLQMFGFLIDPNWARNGQNQLGNSLFVQPIPGSYRLLMAPRRRI